MFLEHLLATHMFISDEDQVHLFEFFNHIPKDGLGCFNWSRDLL